MSYDSWKEYDWEGEEYTAFFEAAKAWAEEEGIESKTDREMLLQYSNHIDALESRYLQEKLDQDRGK